MTFDWQATFNRALQAFDDTPGAQLEQTLRDQFTQHPQAVTNAITKIIDAHKQGRIRSPWGALKTEVDKQIQREAIVDDRLEQRGAEQRAEQWIRNAGKHYDRFDEVADELRSRRTRTGDPTLDWTPALEARMRRAWEQTRPEGEQIEAEADESGRRWNLNQQRIADAIRNTHDTPTEVPA